MPGPHPAVALSRRAVREAVAGLPDGSTVLVACSGGSDSLALAAAAAFECPRRGLRAGAVVVDHRLQAGSADVAAHAAEQCRGLGLDPVGVQTVEVRPGGGPEAAARTARYAALARACEQHGAGAVLLGHTADDQAEQVLLGLVRGSGTRSLAGIPPVGPLPSARFMSPRPDAGDTKRALGEDGPVGIRPFLHEVGRSHTRAACTALGLAWWEDPHNRDPRFLRVRAREAVAHLEEALGPGVVAGLGRTAAIARADADHLDGQAAREADRLGDAPWPADDLAAIPPAVRSRVWRVLMVRSGATGADVGRVHVQTLDALLTRWHGQGPIDVPGGLTVRRTGSWLVVEARPVQ